MRMMPTRRFALQPEGILALTQTLSFDKRFILFGMLRGCRHFFPLSAMVTTHMTYQAIPRREECAPNFQLLNRASIDKPVHALLKWTKSEQRDKICEHVYAIHSAPRVGVGLARANCGCFRTLAFASAST